ncbi:unnamed protein product [Calypogeia fissa]
MDYKVALVPAILVIAFAMISTVSTTRPGITTHVECNKRCSEPSAPAYGPAMAPAGLPVAGSANVKAAVKVDKSVNGKQVGTQAWDSKSRFCTDGALQPAHLEAEETHILRIKNKGIFGSTKDGKLTLGANESKDFAYKTVKFYFKNFLNKENGVLENDLKAGLDEIKTTCCPKDVPCPGGWVEFGSALNPTEFFARIAPAPVAAAA